jgi:osmotically-inducible protein OsmY
MKPTISDESLRNAVLEELAGDPEVLADFISVTAADGAIVLGGHVRTDHHEKHEAVRAAERVEAVRAVADDIEVREPALHERADDEIAEEIARRRGVEVESPDSVGMQVRDGRVILHGQVESESQRDFVDSAARELTGVHAVTDLIEVQPPVEHIAADVERRVQEAIADAPDVDANTVQVTVDDGVARLHGRLPTVTALQAAMEAAKTAPGVMSVESEIVVAP